MKYEEIQLLLDRYWEGETTLEEEQKIKTYFNSGSIDPRLQAVAPLFIALREEQKVQLLSKAKAAPMRPQLYQWAAAASVALLLTAGWWMLSADHPETTVVAQAPVQQPTVSEQQVVAAPQEKTPHTLRINLPRRKASGRKTRQAIAVNEETAQAMEEIKAALSLVSSKLENGKARAVKGAILLETMEKVPRRKTG